MTDSRQYDTVAFDVRDNATMLFFAKTTEIGDITDYLLLMRTIEEDFDESIYIEINEQQFGGHNLIREAALRHDCFATFMAKPIEDEPGSAMHIHHSVIDRKTGKATFTRVRTVVEDDEFENYQAEFTVEQAKHDMQSQALSLARTDSISPARSAAISRRGGYSMA